MKANAIRLYKHFCEMVENPKGKDSQERELIKSLAIKNKANMEERFKTGKKYRDDPEIQTLLGNKPEVKKDGKKPKG